MAAASQRLLKLGDARAIIVRCSGVEGDDAIIGHHGGFGFQRDDLRLRLRQLGAQRCASTADQRLGDLIGAAAGFGELAGDLVTAVVFPRAHGLQLVVIGAHGFADQLWREQAALQPRQHARLQRGDGNAGAHATDARPRVMRQPATQPPGFVDGERPAARRAARQAGEEMLGALALMHDGRAEQVRTLSGGAQPKLFLHDAQIGRLDDEPVRGGIDDRGAPAGLGVFDEAAAIEHQPAAIKLLTENAVAHARVAHERAGPPHAAARARNLLLVESVRDGHCGFAASEILEDAANDFRLRGVDLAHAGFAIDGAVAVAAAAGDAAFARHAHLAAPHLLRQIGEEVLGDDAFEARYHGGDLAIGNGVEAHIVARAGAADQVHVGLIAREPVDGFGQHGVNAPPAHIGQQRLQLRTRRHAGARKRGVGIDLKRRRDPGALGVEFARRDLIVDRALGLEVGAVAGVEGGGHLPFPCEIICFGNSNKASQCPERWPSARHDIVQRSIIRKI